MADTTLAEAALQYAETLTDSARATLLPELNRFVRWYGPEKVLGQMRGHDIELYSEALGPATPESTRRADCVRAFFVYLKKAGVLETNLSLHLRLRKSSKSGAIGGAAQQSLVELTEDGVGALRTELDSLMEQRIAVRKEIGKAMLDKDFRENSPLDAAKDKQGHIEARIREVEGTLKRAVVVDSSQADRVTVGSTVLVRNLGSGTTARYHVVGPTEANAADGKISSDSPVGKALLKQAAGDEVEVSAPAGTMRLRIEEVG